MHSESDKYGLKVETFTGRDIFYREGAIGLLDVQRAADALLRHGRKPSVAAIREQLGGGSPNTIAPLLAKYWEKLGGRLGDGPESLERVPDALARVTELLWRRALEEARDRLKILRQPDHKAGGMEELQEQIGKLSVALAEARAREGEHFAQLGRLTQEALEQRAERTRLLDLLKGAQALISKNFIKPERRAPKRLVSRGRRRKSAIQRRNAVHDDRAKKGLKLRLHRKSG